MFAQRAVLSVVLTGTGCFQESAGKEPDQIAGGTRADVRRGADGGGSALRSEGELDRADCGEPRGLGGALPIAARLENGALGDLALNLAQAAPDSGEAGVSRAGDRVIRKRRAPKAACPRAPTSPPGPSPAMDPRAAGARCKEARSPEDSARGQRLQRHVKTQAADVHIKARSTNRKS